MERDLYDYFLHSVLKHHCHFPLYFLAKVKVKKEVICKAKCVHT